MKTKLSLGSSYKEAKAAYHIRVSGVVSHCEVACSDVSGEIGAH